MITDGKFTNEKVVFFYEQIHSSPIDFKSVLETENLTLWEKIHELIKSQSEQYEQQKLKVKASSNLSKMTNISYDLLVNLLNDGYDVIQGRIEVSEDKKTAIQNGVNFLEQFGAKVEEKIKDVYRSNDARAIQKMEDTVFGFVSIASDIQKRVQYLNDENSKVGHTFQSAIKDLGANSNVYGLIVFKKDASSVSKAKKIVPSSLQGSKMATESEKDPEEGVAGQAKKSTQKTKHSRDDSEEHLSIPESQGTKKVKGESGGTAVQKDESGGKDSPSKYIA